LVATRLTVEIAIAMVCSALGQSVRVGKPPRFAGLWETRHQTTLMLVSGFALFSLLRLTVPRVWLSTLSAAIAAGFLVIDISFTHRFIADSLETRALSDLFSQDPSPPGPMMLVVENDRNYRALGRFFPFYELSYLINAGKNGEPRLAISSREIMDPATNNYAQAPVPAVIAALATLCTKYRSSPQYGFGGFVSNGQIETVRLVANRPPPGLFQTISEAVHTGGGVGPQQALAMVRLEREIGPIGGTCVGPCCSKE
jgi:hypothetical protein